MRLNLLIVFASIFIGTSSIDEPKYDSKTCVTAYYVDLNIKL